MTTVTLKDAQAQLPDLIARLRPHESVVIVQDGEPIAYLSPPTPPRHVPQFGSCRDLLTVVADDEEALTDFADYIP